MVLPRRNLSTLGRLRDPMTMNCASERSTGGPHERQPRHRLLQARLRAVRRNLLGAGQASIAYDVVDLIQDPTTLEPVRSLGYLQAPVVVTGDTHWSGLSLQQVRHVRWGGGPTLRVL